MSWRWKRIQDARLRYFLRVRVGRAVGTRVGRVCCEFALGAASSCRRWLGFWQERAGARLKRAVGLFCASSRWTCVGDAAWLVFCEFALGASSLSWCWACFFPVRIGRALGTRGKRGFCEFELGAHWRRAFNGFFGDARWARGSERTPSAVGRGFV